MGHIQCIAHGESNYCGENKYSGNNTVRLQKVYYAWELNYREQNKYYRNHYAGKQM